MALVSPSGEALSAELSSADLTVELTAAEVGAGEMAAAKAERIAALFREHGCCVVSCPETPIVPFADLDRMGERLDFQAALKAAQGTLFSNGTQQRGNGGAPGIAFGSVPRHAEWLSPSVLCNDIIEQAVAAVLGEGCFLHLFSELTNVPGSGTQDLHMVSLLLPRSPPHPTPHTHPPSCCGGLAGRHVVADDGGGGQGRGPPVALPRHQHRRDHGL